MSNVDSETANYIDLSIQQVAAYGEGALAYVEAVLDNSGEIDLDGLAALFGEAPAHAGEQEQNEEEAAETPEERTARIRAQIFSRIVPTAPALDPDTDPGLARNAHYEGEDEGLTWRAKNPANRDKDTITTRYEDRASLGDRAAGTDGDGRVLGPDGNPVADGEWGWVVDQETGLLLLFNPQQITLTDPTGAVSQIDHPGWPRLNELIRQGWKVKTTHHTTPGAGMPVEGAGTMTIAGGYIAAITDQSGHYRPDAAHQLGAMEEMQDQGISMHRPAEPQSEDDEHPYRDARVTLTGASGGGRPTDKAAWLNEAHAQNEHFPTGDVTLSSDQFAQTAGNERQIRNKAGLNAEFEERFGAELRARAGDAPAGPVVSDAPAGLDPATASYTTTDAVLPPSAPPEGEAPAPASGGYAAYTSEGQVAAATGEPSSPPPAPPAVPSGYSPAPAANYVDANGRPIDAATVYIDGSGTYVDISGNPVYSG